jgi:hypothetical protein
MIFAIVSGYLAYKHALAAGKNQWLWCFIGIGIFILTQLIVGAGFGILIAFYLGFSNVPESTFDSTFDETLKQYSAIINVFAIVCSFVSMWLLLKYLDRVPREEVFIQPPPPPSFNETND